jgi:hypothetical protein
VNIGVKTEFSGFYFPPPPDGCGGCKKAVVDGPVLEGSKYIYLGREINSEGNIDLRDNRRKIIVRHSIELWKKILNERNSLKLSFQNFPSS